MAEKVGRNEALCRRDRRSETEVLRPHRVPVSVGRRPSCRPPAPLYGDGHHLPQKAHAGLQRPRTRWALSRSACRPRTSPSRTTSIRRSSRRRTSKTSPAGSEICSAPASTGTASSTRRTPNIISGRKWIFLQMYKHGLAYKTTMPVNWCTSCKCVLANERRCRGCV